MNPVIFRGYDIRGIVGEELNENVVKLLGQSFATFLYRRQIRECVVGMDIRETSPSYTKIFIEALVDAGVSVKNIGLTLTQIMYFSQYHFLSKAGVMITASHNPREYNGLKLANGFSETLVTHEIQELRQIAENKDFKTWETKGSVEEIDVFRFYIDDLFKRIQMTDANFKVVIDSSCSTTGAFLPQILRRAGCTVIEQNTNLDPTFPLGTADPTEQVVLERLAKKVKEEKADMGFSYDSDGDRMGVVDSEGRLIWNDVLVALFAKDILTFLPNSPIVFNALCSKVVSDVIESSNGVPVMWKTGHSFIKAKVKEERAPFGGELSGHFFFMDNFYGHDDGAFSTLRLLQYLKRAKKSLKEAVDELPHYVSSPEIKLGLPDDIKVSFIDTKIRSELTSLYPDGKVIDIDGIRVDTKDEMVIVRASQNGPYITIKFESRTDEGYNNLKRKIKEILTKYSEIDWKTGVNTHAFE